MPIRVEEGQVLHVVFDPGMSDELRAIRMMYVTSELRANGYDVSTDFTSELVVTSRGKEPFSKRPLSAVADSLARYNFMAVIQSTVLNPGKYDYAIIVPIRTLNEAVHGSGHFQVVFKDDRTTLERIFAHLTTWGKEGLVSPVWRQQITVGPENGVGRDEEITWDLAPNEMRSGTAFISRLRADFNLRLVFKPAFVELRLLALHGVNIVTL